MKYKVCIFFFIMSFSQLTYAEELTYHLSFEEWSVPRSVNTILTIDAIVSSLEILQLNTNSSLIIHYPGGDEGSLWATELRGWLISLGLSSSKINLIPGSSNINQLDLEIEINSESELERE